MRKKSKIDFKDVIQRSENQIFTSVEDYIMLLHIERDCHYGMADTSSRIWALIEQPRTVQDICDILKLEYQVDPEVCQNEVISFLEEALMEDLVQCQKPVNADVSARFLQEGSSATEI